MQLKLQKIGHSLMVTIPKIVQKKINISIGDKVELKFKKNIIQLKPVRKKLATEMLNRLYLKGFNFKKTIDYIKKAPYVR